MGGGVEQSLSQNNKPFVIPRSEASSGSEPFAQLINNLTTKEKYSYCVSSGVSGLCPDETLIRNSCILRRFCPQLVAAKSLKKYGTVSFNKAPVSFFWFIFFLCLQDTKKENEHKKKDLLIEDKYLKKLLVDVFLLFIFSFCLRSKKKKRTKKEKHAISKEILKLRNENFRPLIKC